MRVYGTVYTWSVVSVCMGVCTRGAWYECVWDCVHVERCMSVYVSVYTLSVV